MTLAMDDLIAEMERLHREAGKSVLSAAGAMVSLVDNLPRLIATLKAAEGMREAGHYVTMRSGNWDGHPGPIDDLSYAIAAYDAAKGG